MVRCLQTKSPAEYYAVEASLSIKGNLDKPSLNEMIRVLDIPRAQVASLIDTQVEILVQTLNLGLTLNEFQKIDLVSSIMDQYPNESLHDFMLCFKMAKNGLLGPIYNRIDRQTVHQWMGKYLDMKYQELEALNTSGSQEIVIEDPRMLTDEQKKEWHEDYAKRVSNGMQLKKKLDDLTKKSKDESITKQKKEDGYESYRRDYLSGRKASDAGGEVAGNDSTGAPGSIPLSDGRAGAKPNRIHRNRQKPSK
jgi:glutamate mutase epsilon subunit